MIVPEQIISEKEEINFPRAVKKRESKGAGKTEPLKPRCNHNTMSGYGFAVILFNTYLTLHKTSTMEIFTSTAYVQQRFVPRVCAGPT